MHFHLITDCPVLFYPAGVKKVDHNVNEVHYGAEVSIECDDGYSEISNTTSISCQANGKWSASLSGHCFKGKTNK